MEKLRLLGVLCIFVIALVSALTNANDPLVSGLLNTVFIISCGVTGVWLLRIKGLSEVLRVRQRGGRRFGLPAEFPLTDSLGIIVIHDRRQLPDRRMAKNNFYDQKVIATKMASN